MPPPLTHTQCRARMCCLCGEKLKKAMPMSEATELLVRKVCPSIGYDSKVLSFPTGLCSTCQQASYVIKGGKSKVTWGGPVPPSWGKFSLKNIHGVRKCGTSEVRSPSPWLCDICLHVRGSPVGKTGDKSEIKKFLARGEVLQVQESPRKKGWCEKCSQVTGSGLPHPCTPASRKRNVVDLVEKEGQTEAEQILSMGLNNLGAKDDHLELASVIGNRKKMKVSIGASKDENVKVSLETFKKIEKEMDMSRASTLKLQKILKTEVPVEKAVRRKLREWDHVTDDQLLLHKIEDLELKVSATKVKKDKNGNVLEAAVPAHTKPISRDVVVVKDVNEHFDWLCEQRGMEKSTAKFKIYIDGGEGSFKVLASVMDENHDPEIMDTAKEQPGNRLSGVNRVLVLAYVEGLQETHINVRKILELLNFKDLKYKVCGDLKIVNIILGISGHGGKYACAFCYGQCFLVSGPLRTFRHLQEQYSLYLTAGSPVKKMQLYYNVINPCLLNITNLDAPISSIIAQPELHYLLGVVNWMFDLVKKIIGTNNYQQLVDWCRHRGVTIHGYQGGGLDGNNSKRFLSHSQELDQLLPGNSTGAIMDLLGKFDRVVSGCFSYELAADYSERLDLFTTAVWEVIRVCKEDLGITLTVTWKVHMVVCHVKTELDRTGEGLAKDSEQTGEAGHSKMSREMKRFKRDQMNPNHGERMLAGVKRFVSKRIH